MKDYLEFTFLSLLIGGLALFLAGNFLYETYTDTARPKRWHFSTFKNNQQRSHRRIRDIQKVKLREQQRKIREQMRATKEKIREATRY